MYHQNTLSTISPWYEFDESEKRILRLSWSVVGADQHEMEALGTRVYNMIFNQVLPFLKKYVTVIFSFVFLHFQCPDARRLFPFMRFDGKEKETKGFIFQALRFVQV